MRAHSIGAVLLGLLAVAVPAGATRAGEPQSLERLPVTAEDLAGVLGLNIYKFRVAMRPETEFDVVVSVQAAPDAAPRILSRHSFTSPAGADAVDLRLSFLPRDDTARGVLLTQDEEAVYRISCPDCSPGGIVTIIPLPLRDVPGTRKTLMPVNARLSAELSGENETCLVAILASASGEPPSARKSYPRAKISVKFKE